MTLTPLLPVLLALSGAPPQIIVEPGLEPSAQFARQTRKIWSEFEELHLRATGIPARSQFRTLRLAAAPGLRPGRAGHSLLGRIELRPQPQAPLDQRQQAALRHEIAHQFLWSVCPAAQRDRLLHEAFAVATSGELGAWLSEDYQTLPEARRTLEQSRDLNTRRARSALARVLANTLVDARALPVPLVRRLKQCSSGAVWHAMTVDELVEAAYPPVRDALVVVNRHTGAIALEQGAVQQAIPFGSVLKPFIVAGAATSAPRLRPRSAEPEWLCGTTQDVPMDVHTALLRSCNGYFLDWADQKPGVEHFGAYGEFLLALGLSRLPDDATEAIGIRPTLRLSPLAVASAYRVLAELQPELLRVLTRNAVQGTLSQLPTSPALAGVATKTGTVRDARSTPRVGWIVAVDKDHIIVVTRAGQAPRTFAKYMVDQLRRARNLSAEQAVEVQVLGLVPPDRVEAACDGVGVVLTSAGPQLLQPRMQPLATTLQRDSALCLGAPWAVRFPDLHGARRSYAGLFRWSPPPPYRPAADAPVPRRARLARQGSSFVFRTSLALYTAGVLEAEDAAIQGQARAALAQVIAHNAMQHRHNARPLCDTTHCQVFLGTRHPRAQDLKALAQPVLPWRGWLLFSRGGLEPWSQERPVEEVEAILGPGAAELQFHELRVRYVRTNVDGAAVFDEPASISCELLRNRLKLPSCPQRARRERGRFIFLGQGAGHGMGLNVEQAKSSALDADSLLRAAYGKASGR